MLPFYLGWRGPFSPGGAAQGTFVLFQGFARSRLPGVIYGVLLRRMDRSRILKRFQIIFGFGKPNEHLAPSITPKELNDYRTND